MTYALIAEVREVETNEVDKLVTFAKENFGLDAEVDTSAMKSDFFIEVLRSSNKLKLVSTLFNKIFANNPRIVTGAMSGIFPNFRNSLGPFFEVWASKFGPERKVNILAEFPPRTELSLVSTLKFPVTNCPPGTAGITFQRNDYLRKHFKEIMNQVSKGITSITLEGISENGSPKVLDLSGFSVLDRLSIHGCQGFEEVIYPENLPIQNVDIQGCKNLR
ncbi:hypothetical protein N9Y92_02300 [Chlamydiales bacterium]|nr:hypothetical protein [Chlamydiales bacterium]